MFLGLTSLEIRFVMNFMCSSLAYRGDSFSLSTSCRRDPIPLPRVAFSSRLDSSLPMEPRTC